MARMLPAEIRPHTTSDAERLVFSKIRDELSGDWTVLHSVGMTIHPAKPWAEVDFVLIGPPGVFCLEVKGGTVSRVGGVWYTAPQRGPHAGVPSRLNESPFEQVGSAAAKLFDFLQNHSAVIGRAITGYAVATPDVEWLIRGPDVDPSLVYDQHDTLAPFDRYMDRVIRRWNERIGRGWNRRLQVLGRGDKRQIVDALRGDFNLVPSLRATADTADRELLRLTDEQWELFKRLATNPRVLARGGAGTGKTVIAVEETRRLTSADHRVLYICYSRNLANHVRELLSDVRMAAVSTLHGFMHNVVERANRQHELPDVDENDLLTLFLPELALDILLDDSHGQSYDYVVVDEAQDLLRDAYIDIIEVLVGGKLHDGNWRIFLDPNQDLFMGVASEAMSRLRAAGPVEWPLTVNCRNTAPIATQTALLSGVPLNDVLASGGPDVELHWYRSAESQRQTVATTVGDLRREGFNAEAITVLSRYRLERSAARQLKQAVTDISRGAATEQTAGVRFSTIASFKGLESHTVLLIDVDDLTTPEGRASVYVGASRARTMLHVFVADSQRRAFEQLAQEFGRQAADPP